METLKISKTDARGVGFAHNHLMLAKAAVDAGDLARVNAALFAMSQMLEPVLYRLEHADPSLKQISGGIIAPPDDGRYYL